ncbi:MAG: hypothetical protein WBB18_18425 [Nodosilinea sp.]
MSGFKILGAKCPICNGARKKRDCRVSLSTGLNHCRHNEANPGDQWRYVGDDAQGFGMWAWGEGKSADRPLKVSFIPPKKVVPTLPPAARDQGYRVLIPQAGLQPQHRAAMLQRPHVTETELAAIAPYLFTWQGGAAAPAAAGLPGVVAGQLWPRMQNWAIAIPNHLGQITGVQIKNPRGGYLWASHGDQAPVQLPNGELPLGVYGTPTGDGVVNGDEGFFKTAIGAARHGGIHLGAAGGQWARCPVQLRAALDALDCTQFVLNADGGAIANPHVMRAYGDLATLLDSWGIPLAVRWWGQATKTDGDVDEITPDQYQAAQLLHWAEFESMAANASRRATNAKLANQQVMSLANAPVGEFEALQIPPEGQRRLIVLNGQKATHKTGAAIASMVRTADTLTDYNPTRFLSKDKSVKLGTVCHLDERRFAGATHRSNCPESAHKGDQAPQVLTHDEANEVLPRSWQGQLGQQPAQARAALAAQMLAAQVVVLAQDGLYRPVLAAAIRIGGFTPDQVKIIERRRPPSQMLVHLYDSDDFGFHGWLERLVEAVRSGWRVAIPCGSQGMARRIHRMLRRLFPQMRGYCFDGRDSFGKLRSEFAGGPEHFPDNQRRWGGPDRWIAKHQPDWLIFTPVFNSGVSIEQPYFTHQFEYSSPGETATAASQRGERVRAAIGGGLITERHVFLQRRGLPAEVPPEVLTPAYWRDLLHRAAAAQVGDLRGTLEPLGLGAIAKQIESGNVPPIAEYPELVDVLAIQAREIHYKRECLLDEWEGNGWEVRPGQSSEAKLYQTELAAISEEILGVRSRTLAKSPSRTAAASRAPQALANYQGKGEPLGPIEAAKFTRWDIEAKLGESDFLNDPKWWAAYHLEHGNHTQAAQMQGLLRLYLANPDQWREWREWAAMRAIAVNLPAPSEGMPSPPQLPVSPRLMAKVELLATCPGIQQVLEGGLTQCSKDTPQVKAAHRWAIAHNQQLAALSSHRQNVNGYQFTPKTYPVAAFRKVLAMVGVKMVHAGQVKRIHNYRPQTVGDVQRAIARAQEKGRNEASLQRELYRAQHQAEVVEAAQAAVMAVTEAAAPQAAALAAYLAQNFSDDRSTAEVLCNPKISPGDLVRLADKTGWAGVVASIEGATQALVHWFGDPGSTLVNLSCLESAA